MKQEKIKSSSLINIFFGGILTVVCLVILPSSARADVSTSTIDVSSDTGSATSTLATSTISVATSTISDIFFNVHLRYKDTFVFEGMVTSTNPSSVLDTKNVKHSLSISPNALTALLDTDTISDNFAISKLDYYDAYSSFFLDCITLETTTSTKACGNWNYVVDGKFPSVGMDQYALKGGEQVYVYYGNSWNITASTSTFYLGTTTTLSTWKYNFSDASNEYLADGNDMVDISVSNPASTGWWDTTVTTSTLTTNASGTVDFVPYATGTYYAKITSPDYSKWSNAITLNVIDVPVVATSTATSTPSGNNDSNGGSSGGSGGGSSGVSAETISADVIEQKVKLILDFLKSRQGDDGKIIDGSTTDWSIMSFGAHSEYAEDIKKGSKSLLDFAKGDNGIDQEMNICAAYARRIMALRAAGITSSDSIITPLVKHLVDHCGATGDQNLDGANDDIFIVFALLSTGTDPKGDLIEELKINILKTQDTQSGAFYSFGSASPDMTGAGINILSYLKNLGGTVDDQTIVKAKNYLKTTQLADGGWNAWDVSSDPITTLWSMEGINSLNEGQAQWSNAIGKNPWVAMTKQLTDKGYYSSIWDSEGIDWFGTKHAVPALLGKAWPIVLAPKVQPASAGSNNVGFGGSMGGGFVGGNVGGGGSSGGSIIDSTATSTIKTTTSTLSQSTSTMAVFSTSTLAIFVTSTLALSETNNSGIVNSPGAQGVVAEGISASTTAPLNFVARSKKINSPEIVVQKIDQKLSADNIGVVKEMPPNGMLPIEKKVAKTAAAGSALVFGGTSILLLLRLLLSIL